MGDDAKETKFMTYVRLTTFSASRPAMVGVKETQFKNQIRLDAEGHSSSRDVALATVKCTVWQA